ncbi:MAG: glycosyltransferase family 2 protein [Candidatus Omnitrophica bacterium]|nr:glycosyltransferase family 2 protein [Candidatus Omnitrophota bacterium]
MKVSVVICTYARPEAANRLLIELKRQRYKDFEVLVVYQGDKGDIGKIKNSIETFFPVRYYYEAIPNLPHARNVAIEQASGEIIIFLDDDSRPRDTLIETHLSDYNDSAVAIVGGRILGERYEENVPESKIGMFREFDGCAYGGFDKDVRCEVMHVRGVNMSVRRNVALKIGGFDERFEGAAEYEDLDFSLRVLRKGYKIIFDPLAVVEHIFFPFGGCRKKSKEEQIYWLYRNHNLAFLNNCNKFFYPIFITECIFRIVMRSLYWRNPRIIRSAFRGICDGWRSYFNKFPLEIDYRR